MDEDAPPFWLQTSNSQSNRRRLRRQSSSLLFNSGILLIFIVLLAFAFVSVVLPPLVSLSSQIFRPHLVKRSWDSLNLVLVLFAVVCGFLTRNSSNDGAEDGRSSGDYYKFSSTPKYGQLQRSNSSTSRQWFDESLDRTPSNRVRSSSSYPDLRQEYWSENPSGNSRWAFQDDTRLSGAYRVPNSDLLYYRSGREERVEERGYYGNLTESGAAEPEQRVAVPPPESSSPSPFDEIVPVEDQPPSPPQTLPPPKAARRKHKRTLEDLPAQEKKDPPHPQSESCQSTGTFHPPSPPPPPPSRDSLPEKRGKSQKKRGGATKEFLISLRRKKKKQRQTSVENLDSFFNLEATLPMPPPSPPPPPPARARHNTFFSTKSKDKRPPLETRALVTTQKATVPVTITRLSNAGENTDSGNESPLVRIPPPPFKMPSFKFEAHGDFVSLKSFKSSQSARPLVTTQKASVPVTITRLSNADENTDSGNESPLVRIPPPPPLPPFKMPSLKFEVHGDFVRLKSFKSSQSGSPDSDEDASIPSDSGDASKVLFCPSPDVNAKADKFIERFRAGLKLEKQQGKGRSNLGPGRV